MTDGDLFNEKTKIKFVFVDGHRFTIREPEKPKDPPKGDMTGKWKLAYTTPEGAEESTADLTMAPDGTLTGTLTSKRGTGTIFAVISASTNLISLSISPSGRNLLT